jgi:hypothetical protein
MAQARGSSDRPVEAQQEAAGQPAPAGPQDTVAPPAPVGQPGSPPSSEREAVAEPTAVSTLPEPAATANGAEDAPDAGPGPELTQQTEEQ